MATAVVAQYSLSNFAADVRAGLLRPGQKELPSKYLYDEIGSALFEVISVLPEYGLTRADERLLSRHAVDIVSRLHSHVLVAELGSGSGRKTKWILEALTRRQRTTYCPIEISPTALARCQSELGQMKYVSIVGFERPYLDGLLAAAAGRHDSEHMLVLFLGSTIGNFDRDAAQRFLAEVRGTLYPGDALLLGTDLEKPLPQLIAAYDDSIGATAAFNLNLLARINRELDADFDLGAFCHEARYNSAERRIEMHLRSLRDQCVTIARAACAVHFAKGETIWTESSHKFRADEIPALAQHVGFRCEEQWIDSEWPFAENLLIAE
jgi:L-histidine N-alpha-methyltransferase